MKHLKAVFWGIASVIALIMAGLALFLPGSLLIWLAGGNDGHFATIWSLIYTLWPIGVMLTLIGYAADALAHPNQERPPRIPGRFTLLAIIWYALPMLLNSASIVLGQLEEHQAAQVVFDWRWASQPVSILLALAAFVVGMQISALLDKHRKSALAS